MHRIILKYDHHYISGPLKGLTVETRVNLTDMDHVRSFIQSLLSKRSSEGYVISLFSGDHYIPGNFQVEPYEIQKDSDSKRYLVSSI